MLHAQGPRHGEGCVPHPQHACAARQCGPGPGALPDRRQRLQRGRSPALLRQRALRHRAGAQRQPDQRPRTEKRAVRRGPPPYQHRQRYRGADQRVGARDGAGRARCAADTRAGVPRRQRGAQAHPRLVRGDRADRRLRPAGLSRPVRHPPAGLRRGRLARVGGRRHRGDAGQRDRGAGGHRPPGGARRGARRGDLHRHRRPAACPAMCRQAILAPLHVRVRLPGAARLGDRRHLGLPGPPELG